MKYSIYKQFLSHHEIKKLINVADSSSYRWIDHIYEGRSLSLGVHKKHNTDNIKFLRAIDDKVAGLVSALPQYEYYKLEQEHAPFGFVKYEKNFFLGPHTDFRHNKSITLNYFLVSWIVLLKPAIKGGKFNIENNTDLLTAPGDLITFPGSTTHEVTKVLEGDRLSIVGFLYHRYKDRE